MGILTFKRNKYRKVEEPKVEEVVKEEEIPAAVEEPVVEEVIQEVVEEANEEKATPARRRTTRK